MTLLIIYVLLAVGVSFLCSILEAVLLSVTPAYIAAKDDRQPVVAARLRQLKESVDRPLAAILSLNTIAHTVGAAGAGAQAAYIFGDAVIGVFSAILTFLILVFSEIIPKTLGATYWKTLAPAVTRILPWLIWSMFPLVKMSQWLTRLLGGSADGTAVSREELAALAEVSHQEGVVEESESRIVKNLLRLNKLQVLDIMTPRIVMFALPEETTVGEALERHEELRFSRIPIYSDSIDHISGVVLKDDILLKAAQDQLDLTLKELRRELLVVANKASLRSAFERLLESGAHIALVTDPYGGTAGLVSLEDIVETLLGLEIVDEADATHDLQALARERWERRARRLGILAEGETLGEDVPKTVGASTDKTAHERDDVIHYGITGGVAPREEKSEETEKSTVAGS